MKRSLCLLATYLVFSFLAPPSAWAQTSAQTAFERGIEAFNGTDYPAALQAFLQARRLGDDSPALRYNIGVTYYRLKRYGAAEREFLELSRAPAWAPVARYNLGLVALRLGRDDAAARHFRAAHTAATEPRLRALARAALERLGRAPPFPPTSLSVALAGGYDSNVALAPEAQVVALTDNSDLFWELSGVLVHHLSTAGLRRLYLHGGLYWRDYLSVNEFDQHGLRAGLRREVQRGRWQTTAGGRLDTAYVDGNRFQHSVALDLQARRLLDGGRDVRGYYELAYIDAGPGFAYLEGWRQRLRVDIGGFCEGSHWRFGYQLELNDREDLASNGEFFSYSPTEHVLFAVLVRSVTNGWRLSARGEYRVARYPDPNLLDGGAAVEREDGGYLIALRAHRKLAGESNRLFVDYSYVSNDSNLPAYDYGRHEVMAGLEAVW